ncbi:flagellar export chaperone FliS [Caldimonas tepidiphila]|uniref:flagellar export chaperone FliS n=1 Tax=Caldimonas tepidiphila TaxID=2315841 RepID=UPI000E5AE09D|nr:flagellar export chaperone FliS [Caldimonas tepidiphila]
MFAAHRNPASAYRRVGVEIGIETASPHKLTTMLFDGALERIAQARGAMARRETELKGRLITQAIRIVEEGLRCALDREKGGELAGNLNELYIYLNTRLLQANLRDDDEALQECSRLLAQLRDAWAGIATEAKAA